MGILKIKKILSFFTGTLLGAGTPYFQCVKGTPDKPGSKEVCPEK